MALATKCPHCNTIFRVAHDQLKLRGGIVRCGACNEVFDGNAALVDPTPKQPVIIDIPAPAQAPATSPELDALISTLDVHASVAPGLEPELASGPELPLDLSAPQAEAAPPADEVFDLDLDVESELEVALSAGEVANAALPPWEDAAAQGLDAAFDAAPASHAYDGRHEPTLDIPDEHLAAVALHDSFELDAYPRARDDEPEGSGRSGAEHEDEHDVKYENEHGDEHGDKHEDKPEDEGHVVTLSGVAERTALAAALDGADRDGADLGADAAGRDGAMDAEPTGPATPVSARPPEEPGFVKRSRRRQQFGKAGRILMACAIPLLLAGVAAQVLGTFRNPLAATVPAFKPALVQACALAGCKVELPAQIDTLSIEQGELQAMADKVFSFATALRNQSASAQAWPHIELILNDGADKPVLRRVFAPREYLPLSADVERGFLPRSEQSVKLYFELAQVQASGYHIAVFYP